MGGVEEPAVFASVKMNKAVAVQGSLLFVEASYTSRGTSWHKQLWDGSLIIQE
jgi:hypothetical protein